MAAKVVAESQKIFFFVIVKECDNVSSANQYQFIK